MAVTVVSKRSSSTTTLRTIRYFATLTLSGTYATGGFTFNPLTVPGTPGSSFEPSRTVLDFQGRSPLGYIYVLTNIATPSTSTVKIFTAANTELANGTTVPEISVPVIVELQKFS